jgi:putative NADH-flavin reductase
VRSVVVGSSKECVVKLVVLGATGGTGLEIIRQALERNHSVTALVRSAEKLRPFGNLINVEQGNLLDSGALERVIRGQDAVVSGFGPRVPVAKAEEHLLEQFAVALTTAMLRIDVRRVVVESVAFLFRGSIIPPVHFLGRLLFPRTVADASAMEGTFERSGLEWTMVRPPELTDKPYTGTYRVEEGRLPSFGFKISRADVADFMLKAVEGRSFSGKIFGVCN